MAGHFRLGDHGVDHAVLMRFPGIRAPPQKHYPGTLYPTEAMQRVQNPAEGNRIAGNYAGKLAVECPGLIHLDNEGVAG